VIAPDRKVMKMAIVYLVTFWIEIIENCHLYESEGESLHTYIGIEDDCCKSCEYASANEYECSM